ncbi:MAG: cupin domain-containing protein [Pseudonocardiaceae bacterium]|nr:cupin domain-containing protein [Pseudonocardiaceae bacterium]
MDAKLNESRQEPVNRDDLVLVHTDQTYEGKQGHIFFAGISRESAGSQALCLHVATVQPGSTHRPHLHENHESAVYIISGHAKCRYGKGLRKELIAEGGDFIYVPAGVPHQTANRSETEPLVAVVVRTDPNEQESVVLLDEPDQ